MRPLPTNDRDDRDKLPLIGGLCLVQRTSTIYGLKICPSSEDFVSYNGLRPRRASRICPSSEDFVSYNGLRPVRPRNSAPRRRTLSRTTDFDHAGPQDLPLVGGLCLVETDFGRNKQGQDNKAGRADEDNADGANRRIKTAKRPTNLAIFTWRRRKILRSTLWSML